MTYLISQIAHNRVCRVFKIVVRVEKGRGIRNFTDIFLLGEGNLRRGDFDNLSSFQS